MEDKINSGGQAVLNCIYASGGWAGNDMNYFCLNTGKRIKGIPIHLILPSSLNNMGRKYFSLSTEDYTTGRNVSSIIYKEALSTTEAVPKVNFY